MPLSVWFWICMFAWLVISAWWGWGTPVEGGRYRIAGFSLLLFVLIAMLGWKVFGAAIK